MTAVAVARGASGRPLPRIIQGGMGFAVSSWRLASEVSRRGQLGVVSGTGLDIVLARRLQDGDSGGAMRRALDAFPVPAVAKRVLDRYFRAKGRPDGVAYRPTPKLAVRQTRAAQELAIVGNFAEVWLAKEGHDQPVGINYLEKVQMATPAAAYGAMLAGVDYVLMGAGIPRDIPQLLDDLAEHRAIAFPVDVAGAAAGEHTVDLDPVGILERELPPLARPVFIAIISAHILASYLVKEPHTRPDGFVIEGPTAGGHNAPPRGKLVVDESGQPVFGPRDDADVAKVAECGLPFWLAGGKGTPEGLAEAEAAGAAGIQVGTIFALSNESGLDPNLREGLVADAADGTLTVRTDRLASPTGFPFKVASVPETLSDPDQAEARPRMCDLGFLGTPFATKRGGVGYRCPSEPLDAFVRKGGDAADVEGRVCLCNALTANVGLPQVRPDGYVEQALVTLGNDLDGPKRLAGMFPAGWSARQALAWLLGEPAHAATA